MYLNTCYSRNTVHIKIWVIYRTDLNIFHLLSETLELQIYEYRALSQELYIMTTHLKTASWKPKGFPLFSICQDSSQLKSWVESSVKFS